jgi:hypothetical protein
MAIFSILRSSSKLKIILSIAGRRPTSEACEIRASGVPITNTITASGKKVRILFFILFPLLKEIFTVSIVSN